MTTSSQNRDSAKPRPSGDHWFEMTATLTQDETLALSDWMDASLEKLETSLDIFSSPKSRGEKISR